MAIQITLGGVQRQNNIVWTSLRIESVITSGIDTCSFDMISTDKTLRPQAGQEIIITDTVLNIRLFAGVVDSVKELFLPQPQFRWSVQCSDYTRWLDKKLVNEKYENQSLGFIVKDILNKYTDMGFTFELPIDAYVGRARVNRSRVGKATGSFDVTIPYIRFNQVPVSDCFKQLADTTGFEWYVDFYKAVKFSKPQSTPAPAVVDDTQSFYSDLELEFDRTQMRNEIIFRGGSYLSDPFTESFKGDSTKREWLLAYQPHDITAKLNGNTKTVGIDFIDDPTTKDFLINFNEKLLKAGTNLSTPSPADTIECTYSYDTPLIFKAKDSTAIDSAKTVDGLGDGIYQFRISDPEFTDRDLVRERIKIELAKMAQTMVIGSFKTNRTDFIVGQLLTVNLTQRNLNDTFLINRTSVEFKSPDKYENTIQFAARYVDMTSIISELLEKSDEVIMREDEVVEELQSFEDDLSLTESLAYVAVAPENRMDIGKMDYMELG